MTTNDYETRMLSVYLDPEQQDERPELREQDQAPRRIVGYAAVFNSLSGDLGGFRERIMPGAFTRSLDAKADVRALVNHDPKQLLGRTSSGTLRLLQDERGLRVEIDDPSATSYGADAVALIKRGDVRGMSFGFLVPKGGERFITAEGKTVRELTNIDLREVTITSIPAYSGTSLTLRVDPEILARAEPAPPNPTLLLAAQQKFRAALASDPI